MSLTVSNIHATKQIERDECVYVCVCELFDSVTVHDEL